MKKIAFFFSVLMCLSLSAQKKKKEKYDDILNTTDIQQIETFLKTAHPEDPRRTVLKPKLIALKNAAWTKGRKDAKPMAARPLIIEVPAEVMKNENSQETEEFKKLMAETSTAHKEKTVNLLNQLFDNDPSNKETIVLIQNNSDCNMIMRIQGKDFYNMAVPAHGENTLVIKKGDYTFQSNICGFKYSSPKSVNKSLVIMLNSPSVNEKGKVDMKPTVLGTPNSGNK